MLVPFQFINSHQSFYGNLCDDCLIPIHKFTSGFYGILGDACLIPVHKFTSGFVLYSV